MFFFNFSERVQLPQPSFTEEFKSGGQTLWDTHAKKVRGKTFKPHAVVHIDTKVVPDQILSLLEPAMRSKIQVIYSRHDQENPIIEDLISDNVKLHAYKLANDAS